jgi:von Willebrand factor A domain-containing protein 8
MVLAMAELCEWEVEHVIITRDTAESDLKQRREIVGGSVVFEDQAPVRAALNGRLLILDGIERAERNVLPTLNNLLENREVYIS